MNDTMQGISSAEFLLFLKERGPVIHNSNIFFRDLYYGAMAFMKARGGRPSHAAADAMAREWAARLVAEGVFTQIDHQSWRLNYPQFALPRQPAPAAVPKPAPVPAAAGASTPAAAQAPAVKQN